MAPVKNRGLQKQSPANNRLLDPVFFSDQCVRITAKDDGSLTKDGGSFTRVEGHGHEERSVLEQPLLQSLVMKYMK